MKMSTGVAAMKMPDRPPMMNIETNEMAQRVGTSNRIEPFHRVPSQLKTLIPVGTAITIDATMNQVCSEYGSPTVNMWWAHTSIEKKPIATVEKAIAL